MVNQDQLENAIEWVARIFGPIDPRVKISGIVPTQKVTPFTAYPEPYSQFLIEIHLPIALEEWGVYRHLTHELVHCLLPNGLPSHQATFLEEGLAEHSSVYFMETNFSLQLADGRIDHGFWRDQSGQGKYKFAFDLIEKVVEEEGLEEMRAAVRTMRADTGLPFANITSDHMSNYFTNTPERLLVELGGNFH